MREHLVPTGLERHTTYLDIGELAQVSIHRDESVIYQLLVVVGPEHVTVLQNTSVTYDHNHNTARTSTVSFYVNEE